MQKFFKRLNLHERIKGTYPPLVCLHGPPGCGKTSILQSILHYHDIREDTIIVILEKQNLMLFDQPLVAMLKAFLHQVLYQTPSLFHYISTFYNALGHQDVLTEHLLWSFISKLFEGAKRYKIVLLVDNILEWSSHVSGFIRGIERIKESTLFELQIIFTASKNEPVQISGPVMDINMTESEPQGLVTQLLTNTAVSNQITGGYIQKATDFALDIPSGNCLTSYLYLRQTSHISNITSPAFLARTLAKLPRESNDIYVNELRIIESNDQETIRWCWSALSWLVNSIRPLTIPELSAAVALHQTDSSISRDTIRRHLSVQMLEDLKHLLSLFIVTDGRDVKMVHETAKEFIRSIDDGVEREGSKLLNHADITILCLRYLDFIWPDCKDIDLPNEPEYGLARYAIEYWPQHFHQAIIQEQGRELKLNNAAQQFLFLNGKWRPWLERYQKSQFRLIRLVPGEIQELQVACGIGLTGVTSHMLLDKTLQLDEDTVSLQRSLNTAIQNGRSTIVPILLNAGARSNDALSLAVEGNMIDILDQLMEYRDNGLGAEASLNKAIFTAATHGRLPALIKILNHPTTSDEMTQIKNTALDLAATAGHKEVVEFLLQTMVQSEGNDAIESPESLFTTNPTTQAPKYPFEVALNIAAQLGHSDIIPILLNAGAKATNSTLEKSAEQQDIKTVRIIIQALKTANHVPGPSLAVHIASERGSSDIVAELLNYGVNVNSRDSSNKTPLHKAASRGHTSVVQLLIQRDADKSAQDNQGAMPCHRAAESGHLEAFKALQEDPKIRLDDRLVVYAASGGHYLMVKYLMSLRPKVAMSDSGNLLNLALINAISGGYLSIVSELNNAGWDLDRRAGTESPLHHAASSGHRHIVLYLLERGAKIDARNEAKRAPIHLACSYPKVVEVLLHNGADIDAVDIDNKTPLHTAAELDQSNEVIESLGILLSYEPHLNIKDNNGDTPLLIAASKAYYTIVALLVKAGADPNVVNIRQSSPLMCVIQSIEDQQANAEECMDILLKHGADVNRLVDGDTPLIIASRKGLLNAVKVLLQRGADITLCGKFRHTAFTKAVVNGHLDVARLLLQNGSDVNSAFSLNMTALYNASRHGRVDMVRFLLENGANHSIGTDGGWSPLNIAADFGRKEIVEILLKNGAYVNHRSQSGYTPLQNASAKGFVQIVEVLLAFGADIQNRTNSGKTALSIARNKGYDEIGEILENYKKE